MLGGQGRHAKITCDPDRNHRNILCAGRRSCARAAWRWSDGCARRRPRRRTRWPNCGRRRRLYRRAIDSVELGPQGSQALSPRALYRTRLCPRASALKPAGEPALEPIPGAIPLTKYSVGETGAAILNARRLVSMSYLNRDIVYIVAGPPARQRADFATEAARNPDDPKNSEESEGG